jgi:hypothetical protein
MGVLDRRRSSAPIWMTAGRDACFVIRFLTGPDGGRRAHFIGLLPALVATSVLWGCANSPGIYDATRSKQAAQVVTDWKAVDTAAVIAAHQTTLNSFRDQDLANVDALAKSSRDLALRGIVGSTIGATKTVPGFRDMSTGLASRIDDKLQTDLVGTLSPDNKLTGAPLAQVDAGVANWWTWQTAQDAQDKLFVSYDIAFKRFKMPGPPRCGDLLTAAKAGDPAYSPRVMQALASLNDKDRDAVVVPTLEAMRSLCGAAKVPAAVFDIKTNFGGGGALGMAVADYQQALGEEAAAEKTAAAAQASYAKSKADYEDAVKASGGDTATDKVKDASGKLKDDVEKLEKVAAATKGLTAKFLSDEKLKSLDDFLTTVNTNVAKGTVPPKTPKAATAAILLPGLIDDAQKVIEDGKTPLNLPLMLKRDQEQLKSDAAALQVSSWKTQIAFKKTLVDTLTEEVITLVAARKDLEKAAAGTTPTKFNALSYTAAASDPSMQLRVKSATLRYLTVIGQLEPKRNKLKYQMIDAQYDEGLAQDALALNRWDSLITLTTGQLADYYENALIKPETLVSLVQLILLAWIGHGANK